MKNVNFILLRVALLILLGLVFMSCSKNNPVSSNPNPNPNPITNPTPTQKGVVPKSGTVAISNDEMNGIQKMNSDSIVFSSVPSGIKVGSIIYSKSYNKKAPKGFLRKVTSISGSTLVTDTASLEDAFKSGNFDFEVYPVSMQNIQGAYKGAVRTMTTSSTSRVYTLNYLIFDQDGNANTTNDQIRLEGSITLNGSIKGSMSFPPLKLSTNFNISSVADLNLVATGSLFYEKEKTLFVADGAPIVAGGVLLTPEVSVSFVPTIESGGYASIGARDSLDIGSSVSYNNGWSSNKTLVNKFIAKPVKIESNGQVKGELFLEFSLYLYESVGPTSRIGAYIECDANVNQNPWWTVSAGIEGQIGIKSRGIASFIGSYYVPFFDSKKVIAQASPNKPPNTSFYYKADTPVTTKTTVWFFGNTSTDDNTPKSQLVGRYDFEGDGSWDTKYLPITDSVSHKYLIAGDYYPVYEVKDKDGLTASASMKIPVKGFNKVVTIQPGPSQGYDTSVFYWDFVSQGTKDYGNAPDSTILEVMEDSNLNIFKSDMLLKFDLSEIPKGSKIVSATLNLYGNTSVNSTVEKPKITLVKLKNDWDEKKVELNTIPSYDKIGDFTFEIARGWISFNVEGTVQKWVNGESNYGFGLMTDQNTLNGEYYSSNSNDSSKRPTLVITYQ